MSVRKFEVTEGQLLPMVERSVHEFVGGGCGGSGGRRRRKKGHILWGRNEGALDMLYASAMRTRQELGLERHVMMLRASGHPSTFKDEMLRSFERDNPCLIAHMQEFVCAGRGEADGQGTFPDSPLRDLHTNTLRCFLRRRDFEMLSMVYNCWVRAKQRVVVMIDQWDRVPGDDSSLHHTWRSMKRCPDVMRIFVPGEEWNAWGHKVCPRWELEDVTRIGPAWDDQRWIDHDRMGYLEIVDRMQMASLSRELSFTRHFGETSLPLEKPGEFYIWQVKKVD